MAKQINTRIQLKYDSLQNWSNSTLILGAGEVAICTLAPFTNEENPAVSSGQHPVLFKVGNGSKKFSELPWVSGLAADVYAWAKKEAPDWTDFPALPLEVIDSDSGKFVTDVTYANNKLTITRSDVDWTDVKNAPAFALKSEIPTNIGVMSVAKKDATAIEIDDTDAANPKVGFKIAATQGDNVTVTQTNDGLKVEVDTGVHAVSLAGGTNNGTVKLTVDGATTDNIAVTGLKALAYKDSLVKGDVGLGNVDNTADVDKPVSTLQQKAIDDALAEAKKYADDNDTNTAHTHSAGSGTKVSAAGGIDGDVKVNLNVAFELVDNIIKLYDKDDITKAAIASLDATDFIADGMLSSVTPDENNNKLIFAWNTDAGITTTEIPFDKIADIYTGTANSEISVAVSNTNEISATLVNGGVTEEKLAESVKTKLNKEWQPIGNYKTTQTAVADQNLSGAKIIKGIAQNANGEITVSTRDLTPADIGAQPAGNYKTVQETKDYAGSTVKTVTNVAQDANGVVTVTYGDIAFPEVNIPVGSGAVAIATEADGVVTLNGGVKLNDHTLEDDASKSDITLAKVATTGSTDDLEGGEEVWVFYCGNASTDILEATMVPNNAGGTTAII